MQATAGDFLSRWSRRKLEGRDSAPDPGDGQAVTPPGAGDAAAPAPTEEPVRELTDADMPPLETLDADSDYTPFMSPGVSEALRRLALRKLFNQPDFNVTDGLNDYDDAYTQFASLGGVVTHEMKRMLLRELEARQAESPAAQVPGAGSDGPAAEAAADAVTADTGTDAADHDGPGGDDDGAQDEAT